MLERFIRLRLWARGGGLSILMRAFFCVPLRLVLPSQDAARERERSFCSAERGVPQSHAGKRRKLPTDDLSGGHVGLFDV